MEKVPMRLAGRSHGRRELGPLFFLSQVSEVSREDTEVCVSRPEAGTNQQPQPPAASQPHSILPAPRQNHRHSILTLSPNLFPNVLIQTEGQTDQS